MGNTTIDPELKALQDAERERVAAEAAAAKAEREAADAAEMSALEKSQAAQATALGKYNQAQYENIGQIVGDIQGKVDAASVKDEAARKRENAFRYISGLGDTLSSFANLVGVANGAANQQQTYNSHAVVQKAEEARKARKLEMDDLSKRLDEMKTRQRELKAAGSLKEAELAAASAKEKAALERTQRTAAEAEKKFYATKGDQAVQTATSQFNTNRAFNAQQAQVKQAQENWQKTYNMQYAKFKDEQNAKNYNFTFADGSIDIPKDKLNDVNVERIFQMLPEEIKNSVKGEQTTIYETDEFGNSVRKTGNKAPTLAQKLAAIGAYADKEENIRNELKRLVPPKGKSGRDWSNREE